MGFDCQVTIPTPLTGVLLSAPMVLQTSSSAAAGGLRELLPGYRNRFYGLGMVWGRFGGSGFRV